MVSACYVSPNISSDFIPVEVLLLGGVMLVVIVLILHISFLNFV